MKIPAWFKDKIQSHPYNIFQLYAQHQIIRIAWYAYRMGRKSAEVEIKEKEEGK